MFRWNARYFQRFCHGLFENWTSYLARATRIQFVTRYRAEFSTARWYWWIKRCQTTTDSRNTLPSYRTRRENSYRPLSRRTIEARTRHRASISAITACAHVEMNLFQCWLELQSEINCHYRVLIGAATRDNQRFITNSWQGHGWSFTSRNYDTLFFFALTRSSKGIFECHAFGANILFADKNSKPKKKKKEKIQFWRIAQLERYFVASTILLRAPTAAI